MEILEVLANNSEWMSISQISKELGLTASTVHRLLAEMMEYNLVIHNEYSRTYLIGPGLLSLGFAYLRKNTIASIGQPYLKECSDSLGETACLAALTNHRVVCVAAQMVENPERPLQLFMGVGKTLPLNAAAASWAILA